MKRIYIKEEYCIGCRLCEIHCITAHSAYPGDILRTFKCDKELPLSKIVFEEKKPLSFALQCRHCDEANCVKSCITGAMYKDAETGIVLNNEDKCVGCWTCVAACPYGAIKINDNQKKIISKCDFCINQEEIPACVKNCPNEALYLSSEGEGEK